MKKSLIWLIAVAGILGAFFVYRSRFATDSLNVDPQAAKEIEKAKGR